MAHFGNHMIPIRGNARCPVPPIATIILIAVNVMLFFYEVSLPEAALDKLILDLGVVPARQTWALDNAPHAVQLWAMPVITSMFLHGGWLHLIGNMLFLWVFGDGVECRLGPARFLAFYLLVGVIATQAQIWAAPLSPTPMIGASGAIAGVLGAYVLLQPLARITVLVPILFIPLFFELPALVFVFVWLLEQLYMASLASLSPFAGRATQVAWWAHIGGAVAGCVLLPFLVRPEKRSNRWPDRHAVRPPEYRPLPRPREPFDSDWR